APAARTADAANGDADSDADGAAARTVPTVAAVTLKVATDRTATVAIRLVRCMGPTLGGCRRWRISPRMSKFCESHPGGAGASSDGMTPGGVGPGAIG